jgi:glycosyltransferase involved in cell wall biosynthesis
MPPTQSQELKKRRRKMHVGFDLAPLSPPYTGIPNYMLFLLDGVLRLSPELRFSGFRGIGFEAIGHVKLAAIAARGGKFLPGFNVASGHQLEKPSSGWSPLLRRLLRKSPSLHQLATLTRGGLYKVQSRNSGIDLFHAFVYRAPARAKVPVLPVWYDLSHVRVPETHPVARLRWLEKAAREAQDAPVIQTISAFTANELSSLLGIDRSRIRIVYPGVSPVSAGQADEAVLKRLNLQPFQYAISVSTLEPRKNLRSIVIAYSRLPNEIRTRYPLCIVGANGWGDLSLPPDTIALERQGSIRFLGFVSDQTLAVLFANTRLMVYPSVYEGFGMPIVEALARGAPVACSNAASMPEAAGDTATLIAPLDVESWTEALERSYSDGSHADPALRVQRQRHAQQFNWETAAQQVLEMYQMYDRA